jgi:hypothetical protein
VIYCEATKNNVLAAIKSDETLQIVKTVALQDTQVRTKVFPVPRSITAFKRVLSEVEHSPSNLTNLLGQFG